MSLRLQSIPATVYRPSVLPSTPSKTESSALQRAGRKRRTRRVRPRPPPKKAAVRGPPEAGFGAGHHERLAEIRIAQAPAPGIGQRAGWRRGAVRLAPCSTREKPSLGLRWPVLESGPPGTACWDQDSTGCRRRASVNWWVGGGGILCENSSATAGLPAQRTRTRNRRRPASQRRSQCP